MFSGKWRSSDERASEGGHKKRADPPPEKLPPNERTRHPSRYQRFVVAVSIRLSVFFLRGDAIIIFNKTAFIDRIVKIIWVKLIMMSSAQCAMF